MLKSEDYRRELLDKKIIAFVPIGNSMWPTLKNKKQSVIIALKTDRLAYFDVGLYVRSDGTTVLHRVLEVKKDGYVMVGDSQDYREVVKEESVIGVMVGFYRGSKYIDANDQRYLKRTERWLRRKRQRKIKLKIFYTIQKLKRLFNKDKRDV